MFSLIANIRVLKRSTRLACKLDEPKWQNVEYNNTDVEEESVSEEESFDFVPDIDSDTGDDDIEVMAEFSED